MEHSTGSVGEITNLEPCDGVQNLMQTGWDQQTVYETEDARTECASAHDPLTTGADCILHRRPDVTKDSGKNQTEEAGCDRNETFPTEEAQEVRQFNIRPAVVDHTADQTGDDTRQNTHINGRVDGDHRFGQDEVTDTAG